METDKQNKAARKRRKWREKQGREAEGKLFSL